MHRRARMLHDIGVMFIMGAAFECPCWQGSMTQA